MKPRVCQVSKFYESRSHPEENVYLGGLEQAVRDIATGLRDRADIDVLAARARGRGGSEVVDGVRVRRAASAGILLAQPLAPGLPLRMRRSRYDLLHVHLPNPIASAGIPGPRTGVVVHYHSDMVRQRFTRRLVQPFVERLLRRADRIIVTSPALLEASDALRAHRDRCVAVPFGIDPASVGEADGGRARTDFSLAPDDCVLLFVGRLVYYKGVDVLIEAMADVPAAKLVVVGDGPLRGDLEALAARRGVADRVRFAGRRTDLEPLYRMADVFVLPAVAPSEAFGIVQIEAMARGLPVVNTSVPSGVPWVSRDGESGLTVRPGDAAGLAAALRRLVGDTGLRSRLSEGALRRSSELTLERYLDGIWDVWAGVLRARGYPVDR